MDKSLRPQYMILLLFAVTVGLYCSSLIEISLKPAIIGIDDRGLLQFLLNHKFTLHDVFCARNPGKYFRPLLGLTYLIDQKFWGETIFGYRLTNVILHTCNAFFVYTIVRALFKNDPSRNELSFGAALLFAVHPIAVESVAWISGRTDLLVTFWSLLAFYLYLSANDKNAICMLPLSLVCALAAVLSKETGIIIFLIFIGWDAYYRKYFGFLKGKLSSVFVVLLIAVGILYFVLRFNALSSRDMSMAMIWSRIISGDALSQIKLFFASYGFYFKKFAEPFPLQLVIDSINVTFYAYLGAIIISLFVAGMFISTVARYQFYYFWALLGLMPAAIVSLTDIAWTPWAERYLYFSMVPLSIISTTLFAQIVDKLQPLLKKVAWVCVAVMIIVFMFFSVQRSHLWNDDCALASDTYKKAPSFIPVAVGYACALKDKGMQDEAEQLLHNAELLSGPKHQVFYQLGLINMNKGDYEGANQYLLRAFYEAGKDKQLMLMGPHVKKTILLSLSDLDIAESKTFTDKKTIYAFQLNAIEYLIAAHNEDLSDTFLLYNIAKLYLLTGNNAQARKYFQEFVQKWDNDVYRQSAEKLLKKIAPGVS